MIDVLFEDNHVLVVNKPAGLLTQPSGTDQESLEARCKAWLKEKYQKPGNVFLEAVHRLDKPVSGIVVFAKKSKALSRLNASQRDKSYQKIYRALLEKPPSQREGTLEHSLTHDDYRARVDPSGKLARLHYKTLGKQGLFTEVEIELDTGRYHQIRAQFAAIGCPLAGDEKYGGSRNYPGPGIALHHFHLQLPHPTTGETLTFEVLPPWESL